MHQGLSLSEGLGFVGIHVVGQIAAGLAMSGAGWWLLRWGLLNCSVGAFSTQYTQYCTPYTLYLFYGMESGMNPYQQPKYMNNNSMIMKRGGANSKQWKILKCSRFPLG
jgi:hypothetical protein